MGSKVLRASSLFIGTCGIVVYTVGLWTWWLEWRQGSFAARPFIDQFWFALNDAIFLSGLPPLLLTIYFLILKKSARANLRGLTYVALFIPIHYFVAVTSAHSTPEVYLPAQLVEFVAAVALIGFWKNEGHQGSDTTSG